LDTLRTKNAPRLNQGPIEVSNLAALFSTLANLLLPAFLLPILLSPSVADAQAVPKGRLLDVQGFEPAVGMSSDTVCSVYLNKKKINYYLAYAGGAKILGKRFIDAGIVRGQLIAVKKEIAAMTPKANRDKKIKKALKKAIVRRDTMKIFTAQLRLCKTNYINPVSDSGIRFEHIEGILQKRCLSCHGVLGWENSEGFYMETGRIVPGNVEASPLYTFLNGNAEGFLPATMPKGLPPLSNLDLMLINSWIMEANDIPATPIPGATPTPGGVIGEGRDLYQLHCAACHGAIDQSAKFGRTAEQIKAAIAAGGTPQMSHLKHLTNEQIGKIAGALAQVQPVIEGSIAIKNVSSVSEGNPSDGPIKSIKFEVKLTGKISTPITVGYVTSNGTALADSDYLFKVGTIQFAGNDGETHFIDVDVLTDTYQEPDEFFYVDIGGVSNGVVQISVASASGMIINDDVFSLVSPPAASQVLMAFNFNYDFKDSIGDSDAIPQSDATISSDSKNGAGALLLDSASDYLTIPGPKLVGASAFTFASWVFWDNGTSTSSRVFDFGSSTSNYIYFSPRDSTNRCRFELRGAGTTTFTLQCPVGAQLPKSQWVYLTTTFNPETDEMKIYFDGQQIASRSDVTAPFTALTLTDNRIGRSRAATSVDFAGRVDEVIVWNAALTPDQIVAASQLTASSTFNSLMQVALSSGAPVQNGSILDLGTVETGKDFTTTIFVKNSGPVGLALFNQPNIELVGVNKSSFSIKVQPMEWHADLAMNSMTAFTLRYSPLLPGLKSATILIENSDLLDGGYAIGLKANASGLAVEDAEESQASDSPELSQGKALYATNCSSCHGGLSTSTKAGKSQEAIAGALHPATGVPQMMALGAVLTSDEVMKIVLALNTPMLPSVGNVQVVEDYLPNVGTATYVAETLKDIFLPSGDTTSYGVSDTAIWKVISEYVLGLTITNPPAIVTGRAMFFSRRCQRFDDYCPAEQYSNLLRPIPDTIRAGWYKQACDLVTEKDAAVTNALAKVGFTVDSPITPQAVKTIFESLFTPGREMPQYVADIVSTFPTQAPNLSNTDKYRFILNQFCISGVLEGI